MPELSALLFKRAVIAGLAGVLLGSAGYAIAFTLLTLLFLRYLQERWREKGQDVVLQDWPARAGLRLWSGLVPA